MTDRIQLLTAFDDLLQPERFRDYGPNGLQVEGKIGVRKLVSGVTASRALIEAAIEARADAIFVHHGLFWRGHDGRVTGWLKERLRLLLAYDINLFAYHLPLDAHPELGNNACFGSHLGLRGLSRFGEQDLGWLGEPSGGAPFQDAGALARRRWSQALPVSSAGSPGAQAARKPISRRRLLQVLMPTLPERFPNRRRITRGNVVWPIWPVGTTRPSVTAHRRSPRTSRSSWAWIMSLSRSTTRHETAGCHPGGCRRHRA
jgi:hypothetical protein